jgi:hypothetical protein
MPRIAHVDPPAGTSADRYISLIGLQKLNCQLPNRRAICRRSSSRQRDI